MVIALLIGILLQNSFDQLRQRVRVEMFDEQVKAGERRGGGALTLTPVCPPAHFSLGIASAVTCQVTGYTTGLNLSTLGGDNLSVHSSQVAGSTHQQRQLS